MRKTKSALIFIIVITILSIVVFSGCSSMKSSNKSITITKTLYLGTLKTMVSDYGCIDGLGKLVESGVITKAQANLINQKIQVVMKTQYLSNR